MCLEALFIKLHTITLKLYGHYTILLHKTAGPIFDTKKKNNEELTLVVEEKI